MQTLHYLTLSLLVPPLLDLFAEPKALEYHGGASSVGMIMDWRQMASYPPTEDPTRGWLIAFCWILTSLLE